MDENHTTDEAGHIIGIKYNVKEMPGDIEICRDLTDMLSVYTEVKALFQNRTIEEFYDYLTAERDGLIDLKVVDSEISTLSLNDNEAVIADKMWHGKTKSVVDASGKRRYLRNIYVAKNAIINADYHCEYDKTHYTFKAKGSEHMYVEVHYLIPLSHSSEFNVSLDVSQNAIVLCPNCHACLEIGSDDEREKIIKALYEKRKDLLKEAGINISLVELLGFYGIKKKEDN